MRSVGKKSNGSLWAAPPTAAIPMDVTLLAASASPTAILPTAVLLAVISLVALILAVPPLAVISLIAIVLAVPHAPQRLIACPEVVGSAASNPVVATLLAASPLAAISPVILTASRHISGCPSSVMIPVLAAAGRDFCLEKAFGLRWRAVETPRFSLFSGLYPDRKAFRFWGRGTGPAFRGSILSGKDI